MEVLQYLSQVFARAAEILNEEREDSALSVAMLDGVQTGLDIAMKVETKELKKKMAKQTLEEHARELVLSLTESGQIFMKEVQND